MENFDIKEELKKLPDKPGVYLMHDAEDRIIYVGKAVILKNRVRQYFQKRDDRTPKIERMISQIAWFEYMVTDSETEALVLECNLIKEYHPKYNTMLMDDKTYPFVRVTVEEAFPRIMFARKLKHDKARYYGPFVNAGAVRDAMRLIQKLYKIRTCSRKLPEEIGKERPCLDQHIGLCDAPCAGCVTEEEYGARLAEALRFLEGNYKEVEDAVEQKMLAAAEKMEFEEAAAFRELLFGIRTLRESQKITETGEADRDIIAVAMDEREVLAQVFFVRGGKLIGRDHFRIKAAEGDELPQILSDLLKQFYSGTPFIPGEILLQQMPEEAESIERWLTVKTGHKVSLVAAKRGKKHKLLELAEENAKLLLSQNKEKAKRQEARTIGAQKTLAEMLSLPVLTRIEAYDISNISGFMSVGSMVVFENGKPKPNDYRKFRIKSVDGPNDYASLAEVLTRRFSHGLEEQMMMRENRLDEKYGKFTAFPDLILMDGGKGQVNVAEEVLQGLGLSIPVCGMVKDDRHRTRGLFKDDVELPIDTHSEVFHLITRVQDEAHRFAIEYHRSLRSKGQVHSVLDDIDGIGPARRKALMRTFGNIDDMRAATYKDLLAIPEMNRAAAKTVYAFFHDGEIPDDED